MARVLFIQVLLLMAGFLQNVDAIQLGETRAEIEARHDTAPLGDHPKGIAIYRWDVWKLEIQYMDDVARNLVYTKLDPLTDDDIRSILNQNGGIANWKIQTNGTGAVPTWIRSDGATAVRDLPSNHILTLHGGKMPPSSSITTIFRPPQATPLPPQATLSPANIVSKPPAVATPVPTQAPEPRLNPPLSQKIAVGIFSLAALIGIAQWMARTSQKPKNQVAQVEWQLPKAVDSAAPAFETMSWQNFEILIGEVYRRQGYEVEIASGDGPDGCVDLRLRKDGAVLLVQCKYLNSGKVDVKQIREFYGVIISEKATGGIFINKSSYTMPALNFAEGKEMVLLDGPRVKALIEEAVYPGENIYDIKRWINKFAANAVIMHHTCPYCNSPMVLRSAKNGTRFWGCSTFPRCKGKRNARLELLGDLVYEPQ